MVFGSRSVEGSWRSVACLLTIASVANAADVQANRIAKTAASRTPIVASLTLLVHKVVSLNSCYLHAIAESKNADERLQEAIGPHQSADARCSPRARS